MMSTSIKLGPGKLFIGTPEHGLEPLGETVGGTLEYDPTAYESEEVIETIRTNEAATFEANLTIIAEKFMRPIRGLLRIRNNKDIRRMTHLYRYARKARTRRKNARRVIRASWKAGKI